MNTTDPEEAVQDVLPGGEALLARVRAEARGTTRLRFALGYLSLAGLAPLWDALAAENAELHLLIGNTRSLPTDEQRVAHADSAGQPALAPDLDVAAAARFGRAQVVEETTAALQANLLHLPRTAVNRSLLLGLTRGVAANRVRVRIYPDGRLHAKAYLFEHGDAQAATALVGSSNLSLPSAGDPTELNVALRDPAAVRSVDVWFGQLWDASQEFSRDLFVLLSGTVWLFEAEDSSSNPTK